MPEITVRHEEELEELEPIRRLNRDLLDASRAASRDEVRYIVDGYYQIQEYRKAAFNQLRAANDRGEPALMLNWLAEQAETIEGQIKRAMTAWSEAYTPARWAMSQKGIGPVLSAALLSQLDIERAETAGHFWSFAGLNPMQKWLGKAGAAELMSQVEQLPTEYDEDTDDPYALTPHELAEYDALISQTEESIAESGKRVQTLTPRAVKFICDMTHRSIGNIVRLARDENGLITPASMTAALAKRPWNQQLKVTCWRVGDSFVKVSGPNQPDAFYGQAYRTRKDIEVIRNAGGEHAEECRHVLETRPRLSAEQRSFYEQGLLPPGRIDLRARRWAVKMFLSHLHHVMYEDRYGRPPAQPFIIEQGGHTHYIAPPNWPMA